jgi:hypothetical protein
MTSNSLDIRRSLGDCAEIGGVDLAEDLDAGTIAAIRRAWLDQREGHGNSFPVFPAQAGIPRPHRPSV